MSSYDNKYSEMFKMRKIIRQVSTSLRMFCVNFEEDILEILLYLWMNHERKKFLCGHFKDDGKKVGMMSVGFSISQDANMYQYWFNFHMWDSF